MSAAVPPDYDTFVPPPAGESFIDPISGLPIKRITDAAATPDATRPGKNLDWIGTEYSTMSPFNCDNSRLILVHQSYFGLYSADGQYLRDLPMEISAGSEPRWSRKQYFGIYYIRGNELRWHDIGTGLMRTVREFDEYATVTGMGESDISPDGEHFVFRGVRPDAGSEVFIYDLVADSKSAAFDVSGHGLDSLYVTPHNGVTITWNQPGIERYTGIEYFDGDLQFQRQAAHAGGHMDVCVDGPDEVLCWTNSNDPKPLDGCPNGIAKIRLSDGKQTCLQSLDWSLAVHVSAPDAAGFVYVETFAPSNPGADKWKPHTMELLRVPLDGSGAVSLCHHRSRPCVGNSYNWQPKASCSHDGIQIVFSSNFNLQTLQGRAAQYSDVYLCGTGSSTNSPSSPA